MRLILASKSSRDGFDKGLSTERLINCYPTPAPEGAMSQFELRSVPGLVPHCTLPGPFLRGMKFVDGSLYAVVRGEIMQVRQDGTFSFIASIPDDPNTSISSNRDVITITAQGDYFIVQNGVVSQPGDGRITGEASVTFLDQYTVLCERNGREIEWTEAGQPDIRSGLYFATAEANDDKNVRLHAVGGYLVVLKERSTELWASTQTGGYSAFSRVPGGVMQVGLKAFNLITAAKDEAFFIGHDNVAYISAGGLPTPVSTPAVAQSLARGKPTHCFYYEDRGHRFCVIRFDDRPAWVYDIATGVWHERASGPDHAPWSIIYAEYAYGQWYLGDAKGGLYRTAMAPVDEWQPIRRTVVSREVYMDGAPFTVADLEVLGRFAHSGIESGPDVLIGMDDLAIQSQRGDPLLSQGQNYMATERPSRIWIRTSRDGGHTFSLPKHRDIARKGQHAIRCRWTALGQFRRFCVEINLTDPFEMPLQSDANIEVSR